MTGLITRLILLLHPRNTLHLRVIGWEVIRVSPNAHQNSFFLQEMALNTKTHGWAVCSESKTLEHSTLIDPQPLPQCSVIHAEKGERL